MKERPILFSAPLVRAVLAGTKTQTRRLVNPLMYLVVDGDEDTGRIVEQSSAEFGQRAAENPKVCPYGAVGDRLWVRETLASTEMGWVYRADETKLDFAPEDGERYELATAWASEKRGNVCVSIHMPRWASRISLEVTDVRCERLQSITDDDIRAEGVTAAAVEALLGRMPAPGTTLQELWQLGWDAINGTREGASYAANPWVFAITFRRIHAVA